MAIVMVIMIILGTLILILTTTPHITIIKNSKPHMLPRHKLTILTPIIPLLYILNIQIQLPHYLS